MSSWYILEHDCSIVRDLSYCGSEFIGLQNSESCVIVMLVNVVVFIWTYNVDSSTCYQFVGMTSVAVDRKAVIDTT